MLANTDTRHDANTPESQERARRIRELVEPNLRLAHTIARRVYRSIGGSVDLEELIALGTEGLIQAAMRFDEDAGTAFATYAHYRVRGAIYDGLGGIAPLPRWMYRKVRAARTVDMYLEECARDEPEAHDQHDELDRTIHSLFARLRSAASLFVSSLDAREEEGGQHAEYSESPEEQLAAAERRKFLREVVGRLPERQRDLIRHYYFGETSLVEASNRMGVSRSWATRLHDRAIAGLRQQLRGLQAELL